MKSSADKKSVFLSLIIPVYNEAENILQLAQEIDHALKDVGYSIETIWVNNGSTDQTEDVLKQVHTHFSFYTRVLKLKERGKSIALQAGIDVSYGELIASLDGDLQNSPHDLPKMIKKLSQEYSLCTGWRQKRQDGWQKRLSSQVANFLRRILTFEKIHDVGCGMWVAKKEVFSHVCLRRGFNRFLSAIISREGYQITEIEVSHRPRHKGVSKYGFWQRLIEGFVDFNLFWMRAYRHQIPREKLYTLQEDEGL